MTQSDTRRETWKPIGPPFALHRYQVSDLGQVRSLWRVVKGRTYPGTVLRQSPDSSGYLKVSLTRDDGVKVTRTVHSLVLCAFAGPCPAGMESLHGKEGQHVNRWPENLRWGTPKENAADKPVNGGGPPTFPCRNAPTCGNMVMNEGRRCRDCVARVGRIAADMLNAGFGLETVTDRCGYENYDWVWKLARDFGGYTGTKRDALRQRPSMTQRLKLTLRNRRSNGWGDAA